MTVKEKVKQITGIDLDIFPSNKPRPCIYFIQEEYKSNRIQHVKIGKTKNLYQRFNAIQCGNPYRLWLSHAVICDYKDLDECEKLIHILFQEHHVRGEWFYADPVNRFLVDSDIYGIFTKEDLVKTLKKQEAQND